MIVPVHEIHEILNNGLDEIVLERPPIPKPGTVQALQKHVGATASCHVLIIDTWELNAGGHSVHFRLIRQDRPRFLGPRGGYVHDPRAAMRNGREVEPECVPSYWQSEHSRLIREFEIAKRLDGLADKRREYWQARRRRKAG